MNFDVAWLTGRRLAGVEWFTPDFWRFRFDDGSRIDVECPWRLIHGLRIALSSEDHGQVYGLGVPIDAASRCESLLAGLPVRQAEVRDDTRDILIHFDDHRRLEILPISSGYESWNLIDPSGRQTIA